MKKITILITATVAGASLMTASTAFAASICDSITYTEFQDDVKTAYGETNQFGFGLPMWATLMDHTGKVCWVYSVKGLTWNGATNDGTADDNGGDSAGNNAWLGSRVISAQKANTANAFSLDGLSIPTGAISVAVYPGGSLYGLQHSNPVDTNVAYAGDTSDYGTVSDPLVGISVGGVNVFGGGVALYSGGVKVGAVGASGDTSCRDHTLAWRLRKALELDETPNPDGLTLVATPFALFQQPLCGVNDPDDADYGAVISKSKK